MNDITTKDMLSGVITPDSCQIPLISFNAVYDLDIGLINLIKNEYLDQRVFKKEFFNQSNKNIIKQSYNRIDFNPLTLFVKDNIDSKLLDDYYNEFMEKRQKDIIDLCVTTELVNLIKLFNESKEIFPIIFYYNDYQKEELISNELIYNNRMIYIDDISEKLLRKITQIFVKDIRELSKFSKIKESKTYYISTFGPNFNKETGELKKDENIDNIINYGFNHCISIYDMYDNNKLKET